MQRFKLNPKCLKHGHVNRARIREALTAIGVTEVGITLDFNDDKPLNKPIRFEITANGSKSKADIEQAISAIDLTYEETDSKRFKDYEGWDKIRAWAVKARTKIKELEARIEALEAGNGDGR